MKILRKFTPFKCVLLAAIFLYNPLSLSAEDSEIITEAAAVSSDMSPCLTRNGNTTSVELQLVYSGTDRVNAIMYPKIYVRDSSNLSTAMYGSTDNANRKTVNLTYSGTYVTYTPDSHISIPVSKTSARVSASSTSNSNFIIYVYSVDTADWISTNITSYYVTIH